VNNWVRAERIASKGFPCGFCGWTVPRSGVLPWAGVVKGMRKHVIHRSRQHMNRAIGYFENEPSPVCFDLILDSSPFRHHNLNPVPVRVASFLWRLEEHQRQTVFLTDKIQRSRLVNIQILSDYNAILLCNDRNPVAIARSSGKLLGQVMNLNPIVGSLLKLLQSI